MVKVHRDVTLRQAGVGQLVSTSSLPIQTSINLPSVYEQGEDADVDPRWFAEPDAIVGSFGAAASAYDSGARIIHLAGGTYPDYNWTRPNVFLRNVPGQYVQVALFRSNARNVTLAGVNINSYQARTNFDGSTLLRSCLRQRNSAVGGTNSADPSKPRCFWKEVHWPFRKEFPANDILQVKYGGQMYIEDCYIAGLDRTLGADGHLDTIQVLQPGGVQLGLHIHRSYIGRSQTSSIILSAHGTKVDVRDSYIDWRHGPGYPLGSGGNYLATYDMTWIGNVSHRLHCGEIAWDEQAFLDGWTFHDNVVTEASGGGADTGGSGGIDWSTGGGPPNAGLGRFPNNIYSARVADYPAPEWIAPSWWDEIRGTP